jgi:uncharacterized protein
VDVDARGTSITVAEARRLALARGGLLRPDWTGLRARAPKGEARSRRAAHEVIRRFGYLQLDTVSVAGARSHAIMLHSRLEGLAPHVPERLLAPGEPLFEYWGHEASWLPMELYPAFGFRREEFQTHPWWGDVLGENPRVASAILDRIHGEGPLRSSELEGGSTSGWWNLSVAKKVVSALWSAGTIAVRERKNFQRTYDLAERVIPAKWRGRRMKTIDSLKVLFLNALDGAGWATTGTLAATWRLRRRRAEIARALEELEEEGAIEACALVSSERRGGRHARRTLGWIRPRDLDLAARLRRSRPGSSEGVLLSPFDPLLWDRARVELLFGFEQVLEIFKPAPARRFGYYCLPVLAGEELVARCDVKADRTRGVVSALAVHYETARPSASARRATRRALERYAAAVGLDLAPPERAE